MLRIESCSLCATKFDILQIYEDSPSSKLFTVRSVKSFEFLKFYFVAACKLKHAAPRCRLYDRIADAG